MAGVFNMKLIPLTKGQYVMVDDEDFEYLIQFKWNARKQEGKDHTFYATRTGRKNEGNLYRKTIWIHRSIMKLNDPLLFVDHKDRNGLNCQKSNMRICTRGENMRNRKSSGISSYLGVSKHKCKKLKNGNESLFFKWKAQIRHNNKPERLGYFSNEIDAAKAYDKRAKELHGEFANLNFKD